MSSTHSMRQSRFRTHARWSRIRYQWGMWSLWAYPTCRMPLRGWTCSSMTWIACHRMLRPTMNADCKCRLWVTTPPCPVRGHVRPWKLIGQLELVTGRWIVCIGLTIAQARLPQTQTPCIYIRSMMLQSRHGNKECLRYHIRHHSRLRTRRHSRKDRIFRHHNSPFLVHLWHIGRTSIETEEMR